MNQLIELLDQALQANLGKRQWAVFAAVLRQTVGFRKTEDDLSPRRLQQLTGIRRNHIWQAKKELEALGLLHSRPGHYGEILAFASPPIPPPSAPGTGQSVPETGGSLSRNRPESVPKQDITLSNLTQSNPDSTVGSEADHGLAKAPVAVAGEPESTAVVTASGLQYPPQLSGTERAKAPRQLDGLTPQAAQQVLDVWACKIRNGEVRQSRMGLLVALVKAQRRNQLDTRCLSSRHPASPPPENPRVQQQRLAREHWLEQQAQQAWLRDMQHFGVELSVLQPPGRCLAGGVS